MVELRTFTYIDVMQPQFASYLGTVSRGYLPVAQQASLFVEIAPGIEINRVTDIALKATGRAARRQWSSNALSDCWKCTPSIRAMCAAPVKPSSSNLELTVGRHDCKPRVVSDQIITNVSDYQTMLINRTRYGHMLIGGQTLYILEVHPAGYAVLAANEAEKAAPVNLVETEILRRVRATLPRRRRSGNPRSGTSGARRPSKRCDRSRERRRTRRSSKA